MSMSGKRPPIRRKGLAIRLPLRPHQLARRITPLEDVFLLAHFGVPDIDPTGWTIEIDGMVRRPVRRRPVDDGTIQRCRRAGARNDFYKVNVSVSAEI